MPHPIVHVFSAEQREFIASGMAEDIALWVNDKDAAEHDMSSGNADDLDDHLEALFGIDAIVKKCLGKDVHLHGQVRQEFAAYLDALASGVKDGPALNEAKESIRGSFGTRGFDLLIGAEEALKKESELLGLVVEYGVAYTYQQVGLKPPGKRNVKEIKQAMTEIAGPQHASQMMHIMEDEVNIMLSEACAASHHSKATKKSGAQIKNIR